MNTKHTPGPWAHNGIEPEGDEIGRTATAVWAGAHGSPGTMICLVGERHVLSRAVPEAETRANARLIAAAPELLEALQVGANLIADDLPAWDEEIAPEHFKFSRAASAAIAKATGDAAAAEHQGPRPLSPPRTVALIVEGGVLQAVVANDPKEFAGVRFLLVDYDTDGAGDDLTMIPQENGEPEPAHAGIFTVDPCYFDVEAIANEVKP